MRLLPSKPHREVPLRAFEFLRKHVNPDSLIQIECEQKSPDKMFLCKVIAVTPTKIRVHSYKKNLQNTNETTFTYTDITKMTLNDSYSKTTALALEKFGTTPATKKSRNKFEPQNTKKENS